MVKYIAQKQCRFGETHYLAGDEVPEKEIDPRRVRKLIEYGLLKTVEVPDEPAPAKAPAAKTQVKKKV